MAVVDYWNTLIQGKFVEAIIQPYWDFFGNFFYVWALGLSMMMLFGKIRNYGVITVVGLIIAPMVIQILPEVVQLLIYLGLAIGITSILYKVYH